MASLLREKADGGPSMEIVSRTEWEALDPREDNEPKLEKIELPMKHVTFTHTGTEECYTHAECSAIVRQIQRDHINDAAVPDIIFNFLVGGNGVIYEGRGWDTEPHRPYLYQYLKGTGIEIAYIGDYEDGPPSPLMLRSAFDFLLYGIKTKRIRPEFQSIHLA